jgi:hypothetical protein
LVDAEAEEGIVTAALLGIVEHRSRVATFRA